MAGKAIKIIDKRPVHLSGKGSPGKSGSKSGVSAKGRVKPGRQVDPRPISTSATRVPTGGMQRPGFTMPKSLAKPKPNVGIASSIKSKSKATGPMAGKFSTGKPGYNR